jgi:hypothetical protein
MVEIADLVGYSPEGQIALLVEAKARTGRSRSWAMQTRRNMLSHGDAPNSRFLLLALPDRFYLWKDAGNAADLIEPNYEFDARPFLQPYFERTQIPPDRVSSQSFEFILFSWLNELIQSGVPDSIPEEQRKLLLESGLLEALHGGRIALEVAA